MGLRREEIDAPFVGVVTTWNEAAPVQHRARAPGAGGLANASFDAAVGDLATLIIDER
jgi:hypothetical protein